MLRRADGSSQIWNRSPLLLQTRYGSSNGGRPALCLSFFLVAHEPSLKHNTFRSLCKHCYIFPFNEKIKRFCWRPLLSFFNGLQARTSHGLTDRCSDKYFKRISIYFCCNLAIVVICSCYVINAVNICVLYNSCICVLFLFYLRSENSYIFTYTESYYEI